MMEVTRSPISEWRHFICFACHRDLFKSGIRKFNTLCQIAGC
jgi:hypothetical protein